LREHIVTHFLQHVFGVAAAFTFVGVNRHSRLKV
jgi:hypothetical protein